MRVDYQMNKNEITKAIQIYMLLKGYDVKDIKYDASASTSMFLGIAMDTYVSFNGAKLQLEKLNGDIDKRINFVKKMLKEEKI